MEDCPQLCMGKELTETYHRNVDMVYRMSCLYLKNPADAEDAVQSVFMKLIANPKTFNDCEHEKAWFIITTKNHCINHLRNWWNSRRVDLENLAEVPTWDDDGQYSEVLERLLSLPNKYKYRSLSTLRVMIY